jgi:hypothetical protein
MYNVDAASRVPDPNPHCKSKNINSVSALVLCTGITISVESKEGSPTSSRFERGDSQVFLDRQKM